MKEPRDKPGLPPNWSPSSKHGIGTACNDTSKVWFTVAKGVITEVYYPTVDTANTRDIQFLVSDGLSFFNEEKKDCVHTVERLNAGALAYRVISSAKNGAYRIIKDIVADPAHDSIVMKVSFEPLKSKGELDLYVLFSPHIKNRGYGNTGRAVRYRGRDFLCAWREEIGAALTADVPFKKMSAGYSGYSDGWQELSRTYRLETLYDEAADGNVALIAQIDLSVKKEFTACLAFGANETEAVMEAVCTLKRPYRAIESDYVTGWNKYLSTLKDLGPASCDNGRLYRTSAMVLKAHEDKTHQGIIASLSVPWGEARGDGESGGYHLIWSRDMVSAASGFMAMGDMDAPLRILDYLARTQKPDGSWPQNMWLDGRPYWGGIQLDEVAFPVILAWRLKKMGALKDDRYLMVKKAAAFLVAQGPVTEQDRWEENSGFSPFTLAAGVTALVCAAHWALEAGDKKESEYLFETADYWSSRIEEWTFSECDCISKDDTGHFLRIASAARESLSREEELCHMEVFIKNAPGAETLHQGQVIDGGFLELPRLGVRAQDDEHVVKTLKLVDAVLRVETGYGPLFHRYNNDGYGERADGEPFSGVGVGRLWPLLSGERGVYEAMAGRDPDAYIKAMEGAANEGGLIPEQIWDGDDIPDKGLIKGKGTGSATPLMWAHAEYIKLLRTKADRKGCDIIPEVYKRYVEKKTTKDMSVWKKNKLIKYASAKDLLRIVVDSPATVIWSIDGWKSKGEARMTSTGLGLYYADFMPRTFVSPTTFTFTFRYDEDNTWEGVDYEINIV